MDTVISSNFFKDNADWIIAQLTDPPTASVVVSAFAIDPHRLGQPEKKARVFAMAEKTEERRPWTATEVHKLKGLAGKNIGVARIARALRRTSGAIVEKARILRVPLELQG